MVGGKKIFSAKVNFNLTSKQWNALNRLASSEGLTPSAYLRVLIVMAAQHAGIWPAAETDRITMNEIEDLKRDLENLCLEVAELRLALSSS